MNILDVQIISALAVQFIFQEKKQNREWREREQEKNDRKIYKERTREIKRGRCAYGKLVNVYVKYPYQIKYYIKRFNKEFKVLK